MRHRRGIGEVIGSVSMLAITIALLAGASVIAILSMKQASALIESSNQSNQLQAGIRISVLTSQSNSSGTYLWLYDYGWASAPIRAIYVDGSGVRWTSTCPGDWSHSLCIVNMSPGEKGAVTILIGGVSIAASV